MRLTLKVVPKASRDGIAGWVGDALKVRVTAAPERGKANAAVVEMLAEALGVPKAAVRIVAGAASARKTVEIDGTAADVLARLGWGPNSTPNPDSIPTPTPTRGPAGLTGASPSPVRESKGGDGRRGR